MCHTFLSKSSESEKSSVTPLVLFKNHLINDLKKYDIALLNYAVKLDNAYLTINATQKRFACEAGISRGHANQTSIPRLVEKGYLLKENRGRYDTCIYSLPSIFKQPQIRKLLSDIFPAMKGVSTRYLLSNYYIEKSKCENQNIVDNENLITPIIKDEFLQYYNTNKLSETGQKSNSSPPSKSDFLAKSIKIKQRTLKRAREDFELPADSPWNIPYPWEDSQ